MHPRLNVLVAFHVCARRIPRRLIRPSGARRYVSSNTETAQPNPPLDLDPSFQALLRDVDISLERHNPKDAALPSRRELEALPVEGTEDSLLLPDDAPHDEYSLRKSPAAHFGSQRIGAVILPLELQASITSIIAESDKQRLHQDAKRLFFDESGNSSAEDAWEVEYDVKYRSRRQAERHYERDGTAFASVALPAHFSAITSVLEHIKHRLEPEWSINNVIDWGAGMGSGLWASLYAFQARRLTQDAEDSKVANSRLTSYIGIDKREGLVRIGKRLLQNLDLGALSLSWQKCFQEGDKVQGSLGHNTLALSAFTLSSLPTPIARKALVKEMWESGADVIVLIDHGTKAGFESIAQAREYLLRRKESADSETHTENSSGCHVIAPVLDVAFCFACSHSSFSVLTTEFVRFTTQDPRDLFAAFHNAFNVPHLYGGRNTRVDVKMGRVGEVGRRDLDQKAASPRKELVLHDEHEEMAAVPEHLQESTSLTSTDGQSPETGSLSALESALRLEAYHWPRLVFPPLKNNGHVILDSCTPEGKIMRLTIPRSQGKQPYYDARKSSWGDLFPHEPKNAPQERYQPQRAKREGGTTPTKGADIGKRGKTGLKLERDKSVEAFLKEKQKKSRRDRTARIQALREKS
ncbi:37S ribosomal protein S22 [Pleurotus ostreatus]|uniref:37S ribosomal protein S22 n=1 Tax=Pleurotus ostreatus TaxID=5322 RepID=A0A8H7A1U1_PLEOS|nr:37S ribosomal protein S22 [Pleurotus ostreatus]KAF7436331.1 37S ribosomal protein S22 [Pleurotus ostreatus]